MKGLQFPVIRSAAASGASRLTALAVRSKKYWGYSESRMEIFTPDLTITPEFIEQNQVFVLEVGHTAAGFYSITQKPDESDQIQYRLEHLFVRPDLLGRGLGACLFTHAKNWCAKNKISVLLIVADPNSMGFYEKMGCEYMEEFPSAIPGRTLPLFRLTIF